MFLEHARFQRLADRDQRPPLHALQRSKQRVPLVRAFIGQQELLGAPVGRFLPSFRFSPSRFRGAGREVVVGPIYLMS